jgi:hypothetical protein
MSAQPFALNAQALGAMLALGCLSALQEDKLCLRSQWRGRAIGPAAAGVVLGTWGACPLVGNLASGLRRCLSWWPAGRRVYAHYLPTTKDGGTVRVAAMQGRYMQAACVWTSMF